MVTKSIKKAIIWTTTKGYMPGTNASLNALEYYKYSDVDIFILYWGNHKKELSEEYLDDFKHIHFIDIDTTFINISKSAFWYLVFSDLNFAIQNLSDYDVVLFWGGDLCIINNFSIYFEIAFKTDKLILGTNEHSRNDLSGLSKVWPYKHTWSIPYADVPFFVPTSKFDVIKLILDYQNRNECFLSRMDGLNYAVRDLQEEVIEVPGNLWIMNVPQWIEVYDGGKYLYCFNTKMNSFHRKYWNVSYLKNYIKDHGEISIHNTLIFNKKYNFFNRQCRVKWVDGLEIWDGKML